LYCVGDSYKVFRLDLEIGCFSDSIGLDWNTTINCVDVNDYVGLVYLGTDDGTIEAFDSRSKTPAFVNRLGNYNQEGSTLSGVRKIASKNLNLICGDDEGSIKIFDIRSNEPL